jgi:hypothetical protein
VTLKDGKYSADLYESLVSLYIKTSKKFLVGFVSLLENTILALKYYNKLAKAS